MVKFVKQSDITNYPNRCFTAGLSSVYADVFDNSQSTVNVANQPTDTGLFIEIPTSETPPYGSGDVAGYQLGLYVNNITTDQASNPSLTIWKAKKGITGGLGNFGTTIKRGTDIYSMSSFPEYSADGYFSEDFSNTKGGTTSLLDSSQRSVALGQWFSTPDILWANRHPIMQPTNATTMTFEDWSAEYTTMLPNGQNVIYLKLKEKNIPGVDLSWSAVWGDDDVVTTRKYWVMEKAGKSGSQLSQGYMEWDEGWLRDDDDKPIGGTEGPHRFNSYKLTYELKGSAELEINPDDTTLNAVLSNPKGTAMRLSDTSDGSKNIFKNGLYKDTGVAKSGSASCRFHSLIDANITSADKGLKELFQSVVETSRNKNGYLMVNALKQSSFPTPIQLTKQMGTGSDEEMTTTTDVCGTDLNFCVNIKSIPEIVCKSATEAYFPSRCIAVWFKNRMRNSTEDDYDNVAQDLWANYYDRDDTNFVAMNDASTPAGQNVFAGFFLYKFNGNLYFKSIANTNDGNYGTNFAAAGAGEVGADYVPFNFMGHPTTSATKIEGFSHSTWIDVICRWKTGGQENGFELVLRDSDTKKLIHDQIHVSTTNGGSSVNEDFAFPYYTFATYNCASLGSGGTNINHRPLFDGLGTAAEVGNQAVSNTPQELILNLDRISMSKYGLNYTHLNSTVQDERPSAKISIGCHDGPDFSADLEEGDTMSLASERTSQGPSVPTFLSFGFKNATDVKGASSDYPKHLYFSGFQCGNVAGNSAVPPTRMKWMWTTDAARLGKQLWSSDPAGTGAVDAGTFSGDNNQFQLSGASQNMYFTSAEAGSGPNPTKLLNNEGFQQKGHMFWDEATFSNHTKRENIFCSARVMGTNGRSNKNEDLTTKDPKHIYVDDINILTKWKHGSDDSGETYSVFVYGKPNYKCWKKTGLTVNYTEDVNESGYSKIGFDKNPKRSDAFDAVTGASKVIESDTQTGTHSSKKIVFVAPTLSSSAIDLREYFKAGDVITLANTTGNDGNHTVASVDSATQITFTAGWAGSSNWADTNATIKHKSEDDLIVSTIGDARYDEGFRTFLSPERYWIVGEVHNNDTDDNKLPSKNYDSVVLTDFDMTGSSTGPADFGTDDFGATFSEFKVTDSTINTNSWALDRTASAGGALETATDFGYGAYDAETGKGGYVQRYIPQLNFAEAPQYNIVDLSTYPVVPAGESIYLWLHPQDNNSVTQVNISTFKDSSSKRPFLLTTFEDAIPAHPTLTVEPYKENGFLPHYKWDSSEDDLWYGLLFIDNSQIMNQYHNFIYKIPLNEDLTGYATTSYASLIYLEDEEANLVNPTMPDGVVQDRYDGLAGHTKKFSNSDNSMLRFPATNTGVGTGDKFSFICHVTPDRSAISEETFIAYQRSSTNNTLDYSWQLTLNLQGQVELSVQGKKEDTNLTDTATVLTSSSVIQRDGETPTMVCWTLDNELESSNVKLFINGILEASSGALRTSSVTNSTSQWAKNLVIDNGAEELCIGGYYPRSGTDYLCFNGKIEEIVAYGDCMYPVNPRNGEFVWKKPVKDFIGARGTPLTYVARLFIKDYHNIRGRSTTDVAVSPPVSFIKPVLGNRGD